MYHKLFEKNDYLLKEIRCNQSWSP